MKDLQPWEAVTTSDGKHGQIAGVWYNDAKQPIGYKVKFNNGQTKHYTYDGIKTSARNTYATPEQIKHDAKRVQEVEQMNAALLQDVKELLDEFRKEQEYFSNSPALYGQGAGKAFKIAADRLQLILINRG